MTHSGTGFNRVQVVLGAQWGDEGKGKIVDLLSADQDVICRCQGGNNAGHTVVVGEKVYDFHLLPCGIINENCKSLIGSGVVIHLPGLFSEIKKNEAKGLANWQDRLIISNRAHLVLNFHQSVDGMEESNRGSSSLGTTKKGIGPTYSSKAARHGLRTCDLIGNWDLFTERYHKLGDMYQRQHPDLTLDLDGELEALKMYREQIRPLVHDSVSLMHRWLSEDKKILVEGANASMLDIDFGTYPFVTSSNCSVGGVCTGLGIPCNRVGHVIGVVKAYTTRVGTGGVPTEQENEVGDTLQSVGHEFGVTTGRKRRCGWLDLAVVKYTARINGYTELAVTKLDILDGFKELKVCTGYLKDGLEIDHYPATDEELSSIEPIYATVPGWNCVITSCRSFEDLPPQAQDYINLIKQCVGIPVGFIGVGQARDAIIRVEH